MIYLLDTSALIAHYRKEAGWAQVQTIFDTGDADILLASLSLTELARRLRALGEPAREARERAAQYRLLMTDVVPIDAAVAMAAFDISCTTRARLPLADALIAAAAQSQGACLVHRDEHLAQIPPDVVPQLMLDTGGAGT